MGMNPLAALPEMLVFGGGLTCLIGGSFTPRRRQGRLRLVAAAALLGAVVAATAGARTTGTAFEGAYVIDVSTTAARVVAAAAALVVLALAADETSGTDRESETYALVLFATTGTVILAGARDLLVLAVGFLLASIPLYALIGLGRTKAAAEAALKTYLVGALFGILLLLGVTLLYGAGATTAYPELAGGLADAPTSLIGAGVVAVLAGLTFKAGAVPAHFWVPDAAEGATAVAASFVTTVPKIGAVIAAYRLVLALPETLAWGALVGAIAVGSMTLGNLAAYGQSDP